MESTMRPTSEQAAVCPFHAMQPAAEPPPLAEDSELFFPMHKSVIAQYSTNESGATELNFYYGDKEITFDEPELFAFAEALASKPRFTAGSAAEWGDGYAWPRVRELLEQLLGAGILTYADDAQPVSVTPRDGARASPLPPAETTVARTWDECEAITRELTGRALELGHLELVVPVFRVAHMALDADGRQVGEANVFPKPLRLDVPTKWRTCIYAGSRFQEEKPMNVTALKAMRAHWSEMMAVLARIREAYLRRFPLGPNGWTVADVERLAALVLAVPTYELVRTDKPVANGELHPVLSLVFRVTDGLRVATHMMLFVPVAEATLRPDSPVTSAEIYDYAERNYAFHSTHGVCAGPKAMIDEFFAVLVDGKPPREAAPVSLAPEVETALAAIEQAFDYGLYGLQAHAAVFSLWPVMTRTLDAMAKIVRDCGVVGSTEMDGLRIYLAEKMQILEKGTMHATEEWRSNREAVYAHIYEHCAVGKAEAVPLDRRIRVAPEVTLVNSVRARLARHFGRAAQASPGTMDALAQCLATWFAQAKEILAVAGDVQTRINALLGRQQPKRPFHEADIDIHILLQGDEARRLPHLTQELEPLLGIKVDITRDAIVFD